MPEMYRVAAYVKLAKLWERHRDESIEYWNDYYSQVFVEGGIFKLNKTYIDITGHKEIYKRPEMVRLLRDCLNGEIDCIVAKTKGYLAANPKEFCYLVQFVFNLENDIEIITEDDNYNINTIVNEENQREELQNMVTHFIELKPEEYILWLEYLNEAMKKLDKENK